MSDKATPATDAEVVPNGAMMQLLAVLKEAPDA